MGYPANVATELIGDPTAELAAGPLAVLAFWVDPGGEGRTLMKARGEVARGASTPPVLVVAAADPAADPTVEWKEIGVGGRLSAHRAKKSNAFP